MARQIELRWFRSVVVFAFSAVFCALPMRGQTGAATSASAPAAAAAASAPNGPQPAVPSQVATIHAYSNLVVIDVVVSDSQKNALHGLKASDFTLLENGKPQTIRNFEEHSASTETAVVPVPQLPPGLFTNVSPAPGNGPVNVLLLDYLNTPLISQAQALRQLKDYVNKAPAGTRIAIFGLTYKLDMLQGFTSDMSVLKAALNSTIGRPQFSDVLSSPVNGEPVSDSTFAGTLEGSGVSLGNTFAPAAAVTEVQQVIGQFLAQADAQNTSEIQNMRAVYTLNAFDDLARYLMGIPGRKNVVWFSGSFPLDVEPDVNEGGGSGIGNPNDSVIRNDMEVRKTDNLLTRAQVAVYPVDARGLQGDPSQSAGVATPAALDISSPSSFLNQLAQEQETMYEMADDTGGEAFVNTNGLTQAVTKAIEHGSNYYTLTYVPANAQWDERFRAVKIKVDDPKAKQLNYRNGYYAFNPNDRNQLNAQGSAAALAPPPAMVTAMMHGGPNPSQIEFKVRIRPADTPPEATVLKNDRTNPDPKVKVEGPYKAYGVDMVPDPREVTCAEDAMGNRHCALEIWTYVYNSDGQLLVTTGNRLHRMLTPDDYNKMLAGGMAFHQEISVPVKGLHFLRTGIHDMVSDRVGAVEIPVAQVARLDPLQPPPAAAQPSVPGPEGRSATPAAPANEAAPADTTIDTIASPVEKPVPPPPPPQPTLKRRTTPPDAPTTP